MLKRQQKAAAFTSVCQVRVFLENIRFQRYLLLLLLMQGGVGGRQHKRFFIYNIGNISLLTTACYDNPKACIVF